MSHSSHRPSGQAYYIEDCRISIHLLGTLVQQTATLEVRLRRCLSSWKDVTKDPLQSQQSVIFQVSLISHFVVCRKRPPPLHTATRLYVICSMLALLSSPLSSFHGSLAPNWIMLTSSVSVPYSSRHILPVHIFGGKIIDFFKIHKFLLGTIMF